LSGKRNPGTPRFAALNAGYNSEEEWKVIEERAARRDLASDEEVEEVFSRYRRA
jgi:hypothetical protein